MTLAGQGNGPSLPDHRLTHKSRTVQRLRIPRLGGASAVSSRGGRPSGDGPILRGDPRRLALADPRPVAAEVSSGRAGGRARSMRVPLCARGSSLGQAPVRGSRAADWLAAVGGIPSGARDVLPGLPAGLPGRMGSDAGRIG
ncbi:MAG TPA: hypothetical protein VFR67_27355 [Pilimelia sp.]|nr:hypothetical protein [Pilimelia sp.]